MAAHQLLSSAVRGSDDSDWSVFLVFLIEFDNHTHSSPGKITSETWTDQSLSTLLFTVGGGTVKALVAEVSAEVAPHPIVV